MPVITFEDFIFGLDLRESKVVSDTNRMRELKNGFVTTGKVVRRRPGTTKVITLEVDTVGLHGAAGALHTFTRKPSVTHVNAIMQPDYFKGGTGLNDLSSSGTYSGANTAIFQIEIDATGAPDTFRWKKDKETFTTGVSITGASQSLKEGVSVTFAATTGHTLKDRWFVHAIVITPNQITNNNATVAFGTGTLDDMTGGGGYTPTGTATFDVEIDFLQTGSITAYADGGTGITTVTSATHGIPNGTHVTITGTTAYNGVHIVSNTMTNDFDIPIAFATDEATGTWDYETFKWRKDAGGFAGAVSITPGQMTTLGDGVVIIFASLIGHAVADNWIVTVSAEIAAQEVHFADSFNGFLYVSAEFVGGEVAHNYLDGVGSPFVVDANCPQSKGVLKMEQKIWAVDGDTVAFSATGDPEDWTTAADAGFIAVGLHQEGSDEAVALGQYQQKQMVVFFLDGSQLWNVDPDPALHSLAQILNATRSRYHKSLAPLANDLVYLADAGFRSITETVLTDNQKEDVIGTPIDTLITELIQPSNEPLALYYPDLGQYWCNIDGRVFVYTFSKKNKVSAWSEYGFPWEIDDWTVLNGLLYFRSGNDVHKLDNFKFRDSGAALSATVFTANNLLTNGDFPLDVSSWTQIDAVPLPTTYEGVMRWDPVLKAMELFSGGTFADKDNQNVGAFQNGTVVTSTAYTLSFDVLDDLEMLVEDGASVVVLAQALFVRGSYSESVTNTTTTTSKVIFERNPFGSGRVDNVKLFKTGTLDDGTFSGTYTGAPDAMFTVEIDAEGTPDTFKWKKDEGAFTTGVSITGSAQALSDGVSITFAATTGHTLGDVWTTDTGSVIYEFKMEMPYASAKKPGILKQWQGLDVAFTGTGDISLKYDSNNPSFESDPITITGDTQPTDLLPVELASTSLAPVVTSSVDGEFQVDQITLHYNLLGPR